MESIELFEQMNKSFLTASKEHFTSEGRLRKRNKKVESATIFNKAVPPRTVEMTMGR